MSKHTPGPWTINEAGTLVLGKARGVRFTICHMKNPHFEDQVANIQLIAAAPEMYELLDAALLELEQDGKCTGLIEDIQLLFKRIHGESK